MSAAHVRAILAGVVARCKLNTRRNPCLHAVTAGGHRRMQGNRFPSVHHIEADPREKVNVFGTNAWVIGPYLKVIGEYRKTLEKHPNPKSVNMAEFDR